MAETKTRDEILAAVAGREAAYRGALEGAVTRYLNEQATPLNAHLERACADRWEQLPRENRAFRRLCLELVTVGASAGVEAALDLAFRDEGETPP